MDDVTNVLGESGLGTTTVVCNRNMSWRVLQCLSGPFCEIVQCLCICHSAGRILRLWGSVHYDRGDVLLPSSESDGACSALFQKSIKCLHHVSRFPRSFVLQGRHSCGHIREARLGVTPSHLEVRSMLRNAGLVCGASPGTVKKEVASWPSQICVRRSLRSSLAVCTFCTRCAHC